MNPSPGPPPRANFDSYFGLILVGIDQHCLPRICRYGRRDPAADSQKATAFGGSRGGGPGLLWAADENFRKSPRTWVRSPSLKRLETVSKRSQTHPEKWSVTGSRSRVLEGIRGREYYGFFFGRHRFYSIPMGPLDTPLQYLAHFNSQF